MYLILMEKIIILVREDEDHLLSPDLWVLVEMGTLDHKQNQQMQT